MAVVQVERKRGDWASTYPPLLSIGAVLVLVLAVLPSALNLPQANPSTTSEYAPVPPEDGDSPPDAQGSFNSLGLAGSSSIESASPEARGTTTTVPDELGGLDPGELPEQGTGTKSSSTKKCVGKPARQTEDPLSPPCVAEFSGDNFGETYQGVTGKEVRVLFYFDGGLTNGTSRGTETSPRDAYYDLLEEAKDDDPVAVRNLRALQRYFNERYQTYGRTVHFFVYYGGTLTSRITAETRRSDAAANFARVKPFAVLAYPYAGYQDEYVDSMARRGVLNFGGQIQRPASFFQRYPKLVWSFLPSVEQQARTFAGYVCTKVVRKPVSFAGNDDSPDTRLHRGQPRRLGLVYADDPARPEYKRFAEIVRSRVEECGGSFVVQGTFRRAGYRTPGTTPTTYAQDQMLQFQQQGVTTVIWPQGFETAYSQAAGGLAYRPEWVVAGDLLHESSTNAALQDPTVWSNHAWVVSTVTKVGTEEDGHCFQAVKEADPDAPPDDIIVHCEFIPVYEDIRQLFTGIQVAGPRLTPTSVDRGFHAIPPYRSSTATEPACFYEVGDYTCVKDATAMWWDAGGRSVRGSNGCWKMAEQGRRYLADAWPDENVDARRTDGDECNAYSRAAPI